MTKIRSILFAILLATIWISISEFVRNEFLFKTYWVDHYAGMGLVFPSEPINGAIWGLWSLLFAFAIYVISRRFNLLETFLLAWLVGFILMWVVTGNMGVLPFRILVFAVPLSLLEVWLAAFIILKLSPSDSQS
jgi:hypothetical protein